MTTRAELDLLGTWIRALSIRTRLLSWFDRNKRAMPWRRDRDPYRVLVSEIMLQQTRAGVVVPYFERWTGLWPDFASLAAAPEDDVLAAWSGLGYYRRARWLHQIAKRVVAEHGGRLPEEPAELRELPGVGAYTAAAVASIAFDKPVAVVDGNVERVLVRLLCLQDDPGAARDAVVREAARRLVTMFVGEDPAAIAPPEGLRPGDVNQALMELGATICLPAEPRCVTCPIAKSCLGNRSGLAAKLPRRAKPGAVRDVVLHSALVRRGDAFLLVRRPDESSLLAGMWELPTTAEGEELTALAARLTLQLGREVALPAKQARRYRHSITNRRIVVHVHVVEDDGAGRVSEGDAAAAWVTADSLAKYGLSSMTRKALRAAERADQRRIRRTSSPMSHGSVIGGEQDDAPQT